MEATRGVSKNDQVFKCIYFDFENIVHVVYNSLLSITLLTDFRTLNVRVRFSIILTLMCSQNVLSSIIKIIKKQDCYVGFSWSSCARRPLVSLIVKDSKKFPLEIKWLGIFNFRWDTYVNHCLIKLILNVFTCIRLCDLLTLNVINVCLMYLNILELNV